MNPHTIDTDALVVTNEIEEPNVIKLTLELEAYRAALYSIIDVLVGRFDLPSTAFLYNELYQLASDTLAKYPRPETETEQE